MYWLNTMWLRLTLAILLITLCSCGEKESKRRHKGRSKAKTKQSDKDVDTAALTNVTSVPSQSSTDTKRKQNGYRMWSMDKYPNPNRQPVKCGRHRQSSFLCDPDNILTPKESDEVDGALNETCFQTKCACQSCDSPWFQHDDEQCHGYKVAVGIVYNIRPSEKSGPDYLHTDGPRWAAHLREVEWKFGMCGDDVVIMLIASVHKVYTAVGPNARELLTTDCVNKAHSDTADMLQQSQYKDLLLHMIHLYKDILKSGKSSCKEETGTPLHPAAIAVIALLSAFTVVVIISAICCVWSTCKEKNAGAKRRRSKRSVGETSEFDSKSPYEHRSHCGYTDDFMGHQERRLDSESDYAQYKEAYPMTTDMRRHSPNGRQPGPVQSGPTQPGHGQPGPIQPGRVKPGHSNSNNTVSGYHPAHRLPPHGSDIPLDKQSYYKTKS